MCFSAGASFGASVILTVIGVANIKKTQKTSQLAFAIIPLIFAAQQFSEGFVWLSLTNASFSNVQGISTFVFLFIAQIVWPFWVPFSIMRLKKKENRTIIEKGLVGIGVLVSLYLAYCLLYLNVEAKAIGNHIVYEQAYPKSLIIYGGVFYLIATIVPPFLSKTKHMWTLGLAILVSYIITRILYNDYVLSVWCFFASVISVAVYQIIYQRVSQNKHTDLKTEDNN